MSGTTSPADVRVYNAASLLALPALPPLSAELLVQYGNEGSALGWSLLELRTMRPDLFLAQDWYDECPWASEKLPSGLYVLRLPIPGSNSKEFDEQKALLLPNEEPAHVVLVASALLVIRLSREPDPLKGCYIRTAQQAASVGYHVALGWRGGLLGVGNGWGEVPDHGVWFAGSRIS